MSDFKDKKRPFYTVQSFILELENLSITEKNLLSFLYGLVINGNDCVMSNKYLAWVFMLSDRQIRRLFTSLEQKKYITRKIINETNREILVNINPTKAKIIQTEQDCGQDVQADNLSMLDPGHKRPTPQDNNVLPPRTKTSHNIIDNNIVDKIEPLPVAVSSNFTQREKEAWKLLKSKFNDNWITIKQVRDLLLVHTHKDLAWSIDNFLYDLENSKEKVSNKIVVFTMRVEKQKKGFYEDKRVYHTVDQDRLPSDMQKPKLQFDNPITKLTPKKDNSKKDDVLMYECFTKWQRKAHVSITEKYNTAQSLLEFFKNMVFPTFSRQDINILLGNY